MAVCLVTYIPYNLVIRSVVDIVKGHGDFNYSEAGAEVSGVIAYLIDYMLPQLIADPHKVQLIKPAQVFRGVYGVK
jgi:hypothetical protein